MNTTGNRIVSGKRPQPWSALKLQCEQSCARTKSRISPYLVMAYLLKQKSFGEAYFTCACGPFNASVANLRQYQSKHVNAVLGYFRISDPANKFRYARFEYVHHALPLAVKHSLQTNEITEMHVISACSAGIVQLPVVYLKSLPSLGWDDDAISDWLQKPDLQIDTLLRLWEPIFEAHNYDAGNALEDWNSSGRDHRRCIDTYNCIVLARSFQSAWERDETRG